MIGPIQAINFSRMSPVCKSMKWRIRELLSSGETYEISADLQEWIENSLKKGKKLYMIKKEVIFNDLCFYDEITEEIRRYPKLAEFQRVSELDKLVFWEKYFLLTRESQRKLKNL